MMTSMTTVAVNQEGAFMNVNIIGNKVFVNGSLLPPVPGAKSSVSLSQVGNRLYVNGYEYRIMARLTKKIELYREFAPQKALLETLSLCSNGTLA